MYIERKHIEWDEEKSNRLYAFVAENPPKQETYFGYQVGEGIVNFASYFIHDDFKNLRYLDYGCGCGHIINHFLKTGARIYGVDMSPESVEYVNSKFSSYSNFAGAEIYDGERLPYSDNCFDLITCTEVIEHVLPKHMNNFLDELIRILKPNGIILMTTPNNEDFSINEVCCPECNTIFHKHGHCNRFDKFELRELLEKHAYKTIMCEATDFNLFLRTRSTSILDLSVRDIIAKIRMAVRTYEDRKRRGTIESIEFKRKINTSYSPNLFWVGTKSDNK